MSKVMEKFYCNRKCTVLAELGDEVFIELDLTDVYQHGDYEDCPIETLPEKLLVNTKYITDNKINLEAAFDAKNKALDEKTRQAKSDIAKAKIEAEREIKDIQKKVNKYEGLSQYIDYLDGNIEYLVLWAACYSTDLKILKLSDVTEGGKYAKEPRAFVYRAERRDGLKKVNLYVSQHSDYSGGTKTPAKAFKKLDDAKDFFIEILSKEKTTIDNRTVKECKKWGIDHSRVDDFLFREKKMLEEKKRKDVDKLKKQLTALEA